MQCVAVSPEWVNTANPYGYGPSRRFDTADGTNAFINSYLVPGINAGCKGIIYWQPHGIDDKPAYSWRFWKDFVGKLQLRDAAANNNIANGLLAQPHYIPPAIGNDIATTWQVFAADSRSHFGSKLWYFDSFGWTPSDQKLLSSIRKLNSDVIFTEHATDYTSRLAGLYLEGYYIDNKLSFNHSDAKLKFIKWVSPHTPLLVNMRGIATTTIPDNILQLIKDFGGIPLIQDWTARLYTSLKTLWP
jgi:hypothetical protein